ncbi:CRISPR-associated protein Cas4/endonuclease Cas1 fusion [Thalassoglobus neptunius]|uniref:CRISPR-associated endonuclease Cas1 n=1 Tax=Thalassoglobus neptunius TaxID=1938619 RepID=A0A5C5W833_9PLAN|nr:type I-C CRISPR-associated endonuclease Cas1c [Thalassoglobus neptunius]TWT47058.1 CRISPR-associated protein Cas4/endonuclease Cas1 fusion [Thalassoglobus neptunius]
MKTHLNTLFVTLDGTYLAKDGQAVVVRQDKQTKLRVPLHNLDGIMCFGRVSVSPSLMGACAAGGVSISFLTPYGKFLASVIGFSPGNVLLRRQQYRAADDDQLAASAARSIILGKLVNCRTVFRRAARDATDPHRIERLQATANRLGANIIDVKAASNLDRLRGLEGEAATSYFGAFNDLINTSDSAFEYTRRTKRPPKDPLNALLSFVYALLSHDARSACEAAGLDAAVGMLHRDRPGRPGMALDLMEEFRPFLADRLVLSLINRRQVSASGFEYLETGAVRMDDSTRKTILVAYQVRKQEPITHPFLGERTSVGLLIHLQARLMARWLRGDLETYPPFAWK